MIRESFEGVLPRVKALSLNFPFAELEMQRGTLVKGSKVIFRTYRGVAGVLRRKIVIAVTTALVYGSLAIMLGFWLREQQLLNISETYVIMGLMFVLGLMINGWLTLRLMRTPLEAVEQVENGLVQMAGSKDFHLDYTPDPLDFQASPFLQAYYAMLQHIDSLETGQIEFLGRVTHDIRSPLATILLSAEMLTDSDLRHDDQFIDKTYEVIRRQGNQVSQLLENAVLATEVDVGHSPNQFTEFELDELVECIAGEERFKPIVDFENLVGQAIVYGDPLSLRVAIQNLVDNGIKFSKPNQPIHLRLARAQSSGWIEIQVEDHGIGIEDKDKATVFRRFNRIRNEQTQSIPGNGLGLYIAQRIVEKHKGIIQIDSIVNEGSTFTIRLPLVTQSQRSGG